MVIGLPPTLPGFCHLHSLFIQLLDFLSTRFVLLNIFCAYHLLHWEQKHRTILPQYFSQWQHFDLMTSFPWLSSSTLWQLAKCIFTLPQYFLQWQHSPHNDWLALITFCITSTMFHDTLLQQHFMWHTLSHWQHHPKPANTLCNARAMNYLKAY